MAVVLTRNSYGKSRVRLTKVTHQADFHELIEWNVAIQLEGDFIPAYTVGDNRKVIATDTMKNTVYILARDHSPSNPESFAVLLADHFLNRYPQVSVADIHIEVQGWERISVAGQPHPHAFVGQGPEQRVARAKISRTKRTLIGGIETLYILKTTDSAFRDFHRDEFRTLPDCDDRIFATEMNAEWTYTSTSVDANTHHERIRRTLLETFAGHQSLGVQHTLNAMGTATLEACEAIDEITLTMPNRHRIPFNLTPFGRDNPNQIFIATDEPHGLITGTLRRKP
ncbi:MAG: urate oxidase [Planctomycetes bacterium]|nr:urate oxidase [Planctomycetota bacterium]